LLEVQLPSPSSFTRDSWPNKLLLIDAAEPLLVNPPSGSTATLLSMLATSPAPVITFAAPGGGVRGRRRGVPPRGRVVRLREGGLVALPGDVVVRLDPDRVRAHRG
jgi:hypothetical protein